MRKKLIFSVLLLGIFQTAISQSQIRYKDNLFSGVDSVLEVPYRQVMNVDGKQQQLYLDVYSPSNDVLKKRPILVWVHGGGFVGGSKKGGYLNTYMNELLPKGFMMSSIQYRLGVEKPRSNTTYAEAMYRAVMDVKAAIRHLRKNAEIYGIDPNKIYVGGTSAGSMTVLQLAYMDETEIPKLISADLRKTEVENSDYTISAKVAGVINCWGAMIDQNWLNSGDVPLINLHGTTDVTVPYDSSYAYHGFKYGSKILDARAKSVGVSSELWLYDGVGHNIGRENSLDAAKRIADWLYKQVSSVKFIPPVDKDLPTSQLVKRAIITLKNPVIELANAVLKEKPITVTATFSPRSAGGKHDFHSEGDYWWPDPDNPDGPYIQRDGKTNPENFTAHREAMIRFSKIIGELTSAYVFTKDDNYANQVVIHLNAWFVDTTTRMNPSLLYAQAIKNKVTGRGIGVIDMIQLMEVAQSIMVLEKANLLQPKTLNGSKQWFSEYLNWVTTHPYGIDERDTKNNHATCWTMQVAVFAKLTGNQELIDYCKNRFKTDLLPNQMAEDGGFPRELSRTKPYGYALFNLDAMTTLCHVLSSQQDNLWEFTTPDGKNIKKAVQFMYPFVADKSTWTYPPDVMFFDKWPVAHPFLIFGADAYNQPKWVSLWQQLEHFPTTDEVIRNLPVRNPAIWF